jgi:DNA-binding CsgD family transcriptional regulator
MISYSAALAASVAPGATAPSTASPLPSDPAGVDWGELWLSSDPTPRLIVAPDMKIVRSNKAADALLERKVAGWRVEDDLLVVPEAHRARLQSHLRTAARRPVGLPPLLVYAQRLTAEGHLALSIRDLSRRAAGVELADLQTSLGVTNAEQQTLLLMVGGWSVHEIATRLNRSALTVRTHVRHLHEKLEVTTKEQLFARVLPYVLAA